MTAVDAVEASAPSATDLRQYFYLDPDVAYLNHGAFGATPRPVMESVFRWQIELEREPTRFIQDRLGPALDHARDRLADYVNCSADDLAYVINATIGLNIVIRSLELKPGDEILAPNHEYGALNLTWNHYCQKAGARYVQREIPLPWTDPDVVVDELFAGVTDRTRVIFCSHITSPTALILPVEKICARARELGILTVIDGAHAPGQIPLDMGTIGADIYAGNNHKWLCAPKGSGFLYVRPEHQDWIEGTTVSWGWGPAWVPSADTGRTYSQFIRRNQWSATRNESPFLATPDAIDFLADHRWDAVRARCHRLLSETQARILALSDLEPLTPDDPQWYAQLRAIPIRSRDARAVHRRLWDEYRVEVPCHNHASLPEDVGLVRVSVQGYTTQDDLDRLVSGLATILGSAES